EDRRHDEEDQQDEDAVDQRRHVDADVLIALDARLAEPGHQRTPCRTRPLRAQPETDRLRSAAASCRAAARRTAAARARRPARHACCVTTVSTCARKAR